MLPDGSGAPMSPKIAGKTPGGLLGSPKKKKLDDLMAAYVVLEKDHERWGRLHHCWWHASANSLQIPFA
jgi:hypothetical protein